MERSNTVPTVAVNCWRQPLHWNSPGRCDLPSSLRASIEPQWHNQFLVERAIQAVTDNSLRRVAVHCVDRPGIHGTAQGRWFGLGGIARRRGLPGYATMGSMAAYWSTAARIDAFDAGHFVDQVATMTQLTGELMLADLDAIASMPPATE